MLQRYLDDMEEQLSRMPATWAVEYEGSVDEKALDDALRLLYTSHPVLRARIRVNDQGSLLHVPEGDFPKLLVVDGEESDLLKHVSYAPADPMARVVLIRGESHGFVLFIVNHGVCGYNLLSRMHELWRLYTYIVNGEELSVVPGDSLPLSSRELLKRGFGDLKPSPCNPKPNDVQDGYLYGLRFSPEDTMRLRMAARVGEVPIQGLVMGELAVMLRAHEQSTEPRSMTFRTLVDLRKHLSPAAAASDITLLTAVQIATVRVSSESDPLDVARRLKKEVREGIRRRHNLHLQRDDNSFVDCANNNVGAFSLPHPSSLNIINGKQVAFPPKTKRIRTSPGAKAAFNSYTMNDCLHIYPAFAIETETDSDDVMDAFESRLNDAYGVSPRRTDW